MQESTMERDRDEECVLLERKKKTKKKMECATRVRAECGVISVYFLRVTHPFYPFSWSIKYGDSVYETLHSRGSFSTVSIGKYVFNCSHKDLQEVDITFTCPTHKRKQRISTKTQYP